MVFRHTWFWILNHIVISQCYILPSIHDISSNNKLTWSQAESYCLSMYNSHLLSIHDQSILTNIKQDLSVNNDNIFSNNLQHSNDLKFWIGLLRVETDESSENFGIWIDGSNFDFDFTIHIEEDYNNMNSDTNITSISSHPQYITLQIIDNDLIYSISDGTETQFWICNDKPTTQSTPTYSIQLSIFTVIGILATLCCCVMLLLYAISMKAMKSNTSKPPTTTHTCIDTHNSNSNNDHLSVKITPENSPEMPTGPPMAHKVTSTSLTSIASHLSLRSIMSEKITERVESQSPRRRLGIENAISNVSAGTSVKSGYIETNMVNNNQKPANIAKEHKYKNSKRTFLFNTNSRQSNNSDDECVEGYVKTEKFHMENNVSFDKKVHMENNVSFDKNLILKINNVSLNDNASYNDTLDLDEYKLSIIPPNNSKQITEYNIKISRDKKRVQHKTKNSDGYMLNDRNANEINEKDPLDLGNNEYIVRENTEPKLRLKDLEHSTSIGTIGTVLDQYKAKTNAIASQNDSLYLD